MFHCVLFIVNNKKQENYCYFEANLDNLPETKKKKKKKKKKKETLEKLFYRIQHKFVGNAQAIKKFSYKKNHVTA